MLLNLLPSRRRAEDARVTRFLHAIDLSGRHAVNPAWTAEPTDTVEFPAIILAGTPLPTPRQAPRARRAGIIASAALALTACMSGAPASAGGHGWVANACSRVDQALHAKVGEEVINGVRSDVYDFIPCGAGLSGVDTVSAGRRPYIVNPEPRPDGRDPAPFCMQAGQRYTPNSYGAVLTPVSRCAN